MYVSITAYLIHHAVNSITNAPFIPNKALVLCMEPIAACLALGDRLSWKMNDKYLVRMDGRPRPLRLTTKYRESTLIKHART